jgi:hypothetical protein
MKLSYPGLLLTGAALAATGCAHGRSSDPETSIYELAKSEGGE